MIKPESPIPRDCLHILQETIDGFPGFKRSPPTYKDLKTRYYSISANVRRGKQMSWGSLCSIREDFEREMENIFSPEDCTTIRASIRLCISRIERVLEGQGDAASEAGGGLHEQPNIIFRSSKMRKVMAYVDRLADETMPVLILGETGTGKELIAKHLHETSNRKNQPFLAINCAAIPAGLLESMLFGHKKGAFTGADKDHAGLFETVGSGTLMLDEIGEMPLELQAKILRVIQEGLFRRIGSSNGEIRFKGRVVAATNRNLQEEIKKGRFREDLYFRLGQIPLLIPPLRQRPEDIDPLIDFFMGRLGKDLSLSESARKKLHSHTFPGNVRELEGILKRAHIEATLYDRSKKVIAVEHIHFASEMSEPAADLPRDVEADLEYFKAKVGRLESSVGELRELVVEATVANAEQTSQTGELRGLVEKTIAANAEQTKQTGELRELVEKTIAAHAEQPRKTGKLRGLVEKTIAAHAEQPSETGELRRLPEQRPNPRPQEVRPEIEWSHRLLEQLEDRGKGGPQKDRVVVLTQVVRMFSERKIPVKGRAYEKLFNSDFLRFYMFIMEFVLENGGFDSKKRVGAKTFADATYGTAFTRYTLLLLEDYLVQVGLVTERKYRQIAGE